MNDRKKTNDEALDRARRMRDSLEKEIAKLRRENARLREELDQQHVDPVDRARAALADEGEV